MKRDLKKISGTEYDLIVIGGGIFGICAVWDAALRGLSVALLERGDFSHASSANHFKMVHGGIRYLQHGDIHRVRESSRERSALLRIAPHLVKPIPIVIPTFGHGLKGKEILGTGLFLYDLLTLDRNAGIGDNGKRIPRGRFITTDEIKRLFPDVGKKGLTGGVVFYDGQIYNPPRLGISFLRSAYEAGADAANYIEATGFLRDGNRIIGVQARDVLTDETIEVRGKCVLNTAGAWADRLLRGEAGLQLSPEPIFSRDLAFVVKRTLDEKHGLTLLIRSKDADAVVDRGGRHIFLMPWRGHTLVGVWHSIYRGDPDEISVTEEELRGYIDEVNDAYPELALGLEEITMVNIGLTLFGEVTQQKTAISFGKRSLLIDHGRTHGVEGLVTLIGVRATTARGMAEKAVEIICKKMGKKPPVSGTWKEPVYGGEIDSFDDFSRRALKDRTYGQGMDVMESLICNYGSKYAEVLKYIGEDRTWAETVGESSVLKAEIIHGIREEMALKLNDMVFRRTELGTAEYPGNETLWQCAQLMGGELRWSAERVQREIDDVIDFFSTFSCNFNRGSY
jgi:glycerol-3-phosphate dehydrogenase